LKLHGRGRLFARSRSVRGRRIRGDERGILGVAADKGGDERADRYDA
jgi:hypothetical protein